MINALFKSLDLLLKGVDLLLKGVELLLKGVELLADGMMWAPFYIWEFLKYISYPFKLGSYWLLSKIGPYEPVVLLLIGDNRHLALSKITLNEEQYCWVNVPFKFGRYHKFWLLSNGTVVADENNISPSISSTYICTWLPRFNKEKRLFMILCGVRPFIT